LNLRYKRRVKVWTIHRSRRLAEGFTLWLERKRLVAW